MTAQTRKLSEAPDEDLLACLRVLERKMGLVLTLVWIMLLVCWFTGRFFNFCSSSRRLYGVSLTNNQLQIHQTTTQIRQQT